MKQTDYITQITIFDRTIIQRLQTISNYFAKHPGAFKISAMYCLKLSKDDVDGDEEDKKEDDNCEEDNDEFLA